MSLIERFHCTTKDVEMRTGSVERKQAKWGILTMKLTQWTQLLCDSEYLPDLRVNVVLKVEM